MQFIPTSAVVRQQASGSDLVTICLRRPRTYQKLLTCKEPVNYKHPRQPILEGVWGKRVYVANEAVFNDQDACIRCARVSTDAVAAPSRQLLWTARDVEL